MTLSEKYYSLKSQLDRAETQDEIQECYNEIEKTIIEISTEQLEWTVEGNNLMGLQHEAKERLDAEQE